MILSEMSKDERSLLLYIESVSVEYGGLIDSRKINVGDREILERWDQSGFISYSRLTWASIQTLHNKHCTDLVYLSEEAWRLAHEERRARAFYGFSRRLPSVLSSPPKRKTWK